jgi:hypothetical protein
MAGQKNGSKSDAKETMTMSMKTGTSTSTHNSPTLDELKKDLFIAIEILNGYTEHEALLNWQCTQGICQCP